MGTTLAEAFYEGTQTTVDILEKAQANVLRRLPMGYGIKPVENPYPTVDTNAVIRKWAAELERVYEKQTAGAYTFDGILGEFLREALGLPTITGR